MPLICHTVPKPWLAPTKGRCISSVYNSNFALCTPYEQTRLRCLPHHPTTTPIWQLRRTSSLWRECLFVLTTLIFIIHFLCFIFEGGFASQLKVAVLSWKMLPRKFKTRSHNTQRCVPSRHWNRLGRKMRTLKPTLKQSNLSSSWPRDVRAWGGCVTGWRLENSIFFIMDHLTHAIN